MRGTGKAFAARRPAQRPVPHHGPHGQADRGRRPLRTGRRGGQAVAGPFQDLSDAVWRRRAAAAGRHIQRGRSLPRRRRRVLPKGQYLSGAVLTDRQQRRQEVYRQYSKNRARPAGRGRDVLLAWAKPIDLHFTPSPSAMRRRRPAVAVPLRLERPAAGAARRHPGAVRALPAHHQRGSTRPTLEPAARTSTCTCVSNCPPRCCRSRIERGQGSPPESMRPAVAIALGANRRRPLELPGVDNPLDPIRVDVADERLLRLDAEAGCTLNVSLDPAMPPGQGGGRRPGERRSGPSSTGSRDHGTVQ